MSQQNPNPSPRSPKLTGDDAPPDPNADPIEVHDLVRFHAYLNAMTGATCEAGINCENGAEFFVDQHGCDSSLLCSEHKQMWISELNQGLADGWCLCPECGEEFTSIEDILTERPV